MLCSAPMPQMKMQTADNVLSTNFLIPIAKTVPSDPSDSKVIITTEQLEPLLLHEAVPKKSSNVFLTAKILNSTNYPWLPGECSVYVDNSMSTKLWIRNVVSCNEKFTCSLGIDKSIKLVYKPAHKFGSQIGLLSKAAQMTNEQKLVLKNTKKVPITLTIYEPIPKSADEKIKVKMLSPEIKEIAPANTGAQHKNSVQNGANSEEDPLKMPDLGARLDDLHNLAWTVRLSEGEEKELCVKWCIEYPTNEKLEFNEAFEA